MGTQRYIFGFFWEQIYACVVDHVTMELEVYTFKLFFIPIHLLFFSLLKWFCDTGQDYSKTVLGCKENRRYEMFVFLETHRALTIFQQ